MESGTFADFFQQIQGQSSILGIIRLLAVVFAFTVVGVIYVRVRRGRISKQGQSSNNAGFGNNLFGFISQSSITSTSTSSTNAPIGDMPDLNMLLATEQTPQTTSNNFTAEPSFLRQPGVINIQMSDGRVVEAAEMIIISRDRVSDNLVIQIGDHAYDGSEGGVHPDFRRRFVKIMREVSDIAPTLSKVSDMPVQVNTPEQPKAASPVVQSTPPTESIQEPAVNEQSFDLAGQIEAYLQAKLTTQPQLAARGLHVHSAPDGGVRIEVDGQHFESVDDVEDPVVQRFLQQTIAEWQTTK